MNYLKKSTNLKVWLSLFVYVTAILFVISPDSYLHNGLDHVDSAWFFMDGKALMNGLIPYVDYTDSKGPLLFLLNGIGYLISNYDYIGVFWRSCLWYSITLFFCYKTGTLLTQSRRKGYIVALLMAFPYFCCLFHYETRAEDWCQPFIAASLYCLLKEILRPTRRSQYIAGLSFGITFVATLLIKWSIAVMSLSFVASVVWLLYKRRQSMMKYCVCFTVGAVLMFLPFGVYMIATNSFEAFVHEYFFNTGMTVSEGGAFGFVYGYCKSVAKLFIMKGRYWYVIYMIAIFCYYRKHSSLTLCPLLCGLFFLALTIMHSHWNYYLNASSAFSIFLAVILAECLEQKIQFSTRNIGVIFIVAVILNFANVAKALKRGGLFFQTTGIQEFYDAAYIMSQVNDTKIINCGLEYGIGLPANALPATLHYSHQNGATKEMEDKQKEAIRQHKADFITIAHNDTTAFRNIINAGDYQRYISIPLPDGVFDLYGKKGFKLPSKDFKVSSMDILLKRKIKLADED